ncbi:MAG: tRNA lysidine(34) synthetase TilS [Oscillospiraceae bacterium]|nr:tRNA lysidine(34) synthetase TilS [Oscillospiraceae bacterium]
MNLLPFMKQWQMLPPAGGIVLCAVSGGRDSLCLLHYLHAVAPLEGFSVAAAHFNHQMRPEADSDEEFVRRFCREREIPFFTEASPVYEMARVWKLSVEETGRRLRYDFLQRTAAVVGAAVIATAHHADDNAETVLLNLLRGSGSEGLGGIPPVRGPFIRPLLETSRREVEEYCALHGIDYVEDSTNFDTHYTRARLRHQLWPQLEGINQNLTRTLCRTAGLLREENGYLNELAAQYLPREGWSLSLESLRKAPEVLRRRMIRLMLRRLPTGKQDVSAAHIAEACALAEKGRGTLMLPDGVYVSVYDGEMAFSVERPVPGERMLCEGENRWGEFVIEVNGPCEGLSVRSWQSTDRMIVKNGCRSLKRIFSDAGMPPVLRERTPVLCHHGAVVGVYLGEPTCVFPLTIGDTIVNITIKRKFVEEDTDND